MPRNPLPPLPSSVMAPGGRITIEVHDKLTDEDGGHCWGLWLAPARVIRVEKQPSRAHMWATLYHDLVHAALDDSGLANLLTEAQQEGICDAIATARMRERFG